MPPAPIPSNERERLQALHTCNVLDTLGEAPFDNITSLASELIGAPICLVSLVDECRQWFKSSHGLNEVETPRDQAICGYTILSSKTLVIEDASVNEWTRDSPLVTGPPHVRFYAGHPLILSDGHTVGALCVIDTEPRSLDERERRILESLAFQTVQLLELSKERLVADKMAKKAHDAEQQKANLLTGMREEVRTPIATMLGSIDFLLDGPGDEASMNAQRLSIRRNAEHLVAIMDDMIDIAMKQWANPTAARTGRREAA